MHIYIKLSHHFRQYITFYLLYFKIKYFTQYLFFWGGGKVNALEIKYFFANR